MDRFSPLESIFGAIGGLSHSQNKPVKSALYNALALLLLFVCCAAAWGLYLILEPFIKPLIWALLIGSVLHPLKRSLRDRFRSWFEMLEISHTPIVFGVVLLPINIIADLSEFIGSQLLERWKVIVYTAIGGVVLLVTYQFMPLGLVWIFIDISSAVLNGLMNIATLPFIIVICIGYFSLTYFAWNPDNNRKFHLMSIGIWCLISAYAANCFGTFRMLIFVIFQLTLIGGFAYEVYFTIKSSEGNGVNIMDYFHLIFPNGTKSVENIDETIPEKREDSPEIESTPPPKTSTDETSKTDPWAMELFETKSLKKTNSTTTNPLIRPKKKFQRSLSQPHLASKYKLKTYFADRLSLNNLKEELVDTGKYESTFYLYSVLWACIVMFFWKNIVLLPLIFLPILIYTIKHVGYYFGMWNRLGNYLNIIYDVGKCWCNERCDALAPVPIRGLYKASCQIDASLKTMIENSIDTVASCVVILGLLIFLTCASIFIVFQIYAEAIMMVQITSNVINQTVVNNPELKQLLPPTWDNTVDSILDNAYLYGREGISKAVKSMMADIDPAKSVKFENQLLELWDRLYQSWMSSNDSHGPHVTQEAVQVTWSNFLNDIRKSPEVFNINSIVDFAKQNIGTLMSLLESIWTILKGNVGLIISSLSTFLSVILGGGTAVLNFILNLIVFLTTLFYLLSSSSDLYKPVEFLTGFSTSSERFGHALQDAVSGVFVASFKMAAFYGMWTWFIHNLFGVKIVYLPSVCATLLAAIPFLGTYWACLPAVLDLWLAQDRRPEAVVFAFFQFLPTSIVDTIIYKEIKGGGHPYLTGLAIAGGIFCLGVEGAIVGPLLLCGLYVVIDLSSNLFKETPSEESLNLRLQNE